MKQEYAICQGCPIRLECHTELVPQILTDDGLRLLPVSPYEDEKAWHCRSFTCLRDGMRGARDAKQHGTYTWRTVVELSGRQRRIKTAVFGSPSKRTDILELRVIARNRRIYSQGPDGRYYRAGKYVAPIEI